ncbi:MAG: hypothetical protein IPN89_11470 [Saprospiraceae bacterium]|nr:hypothetical protein [Saprospiraceae bacterium]
MKNFKFKTKYILVIVYCITLNLLMAQCPGANTPDCTVGDPYFGVAINEVSGDGGNIDSRNDAIVELAGPVGTNIGCMVITNGEWAVVLPTGTVIPADGVFIIGCGSSSEPSGYEPVSGLTCSVCDFEGMALDFDVCLPANAIYVSSSISTYGFTLDNGYCGTSTDGDQVILFQPDGTPQDAIVWGGNPSIPQTTTGGLTVYSGSTGLCGANSDHISIQDNMTYTLGDNDNNGIINDYTGSHVGRRSDGTNAIGVNIMPAGDCGANTKCYKMPGILDPIWVYAGNSFTGCNSSYVRLNGTTGSQSVGISADNPSHMDDPDCSSFSLSNPLTPSSCSNSGALAQWGYTDHPTPGQPNNVDVWDLFVTICGVTTEVSNSCKGTLDLYACNPTDVTFEYRIYNWQHVSGEGGLTSTGETGHTTPALFGSYINIPASAGGTGAPSPWTYANNLTSGVTTLTSTTSAVPVGNHSFVLQWKDYIYDCCGSSSATSNNECYERVTVRINIVAPLAVTSTSLVCPPTTAGTVNVKTAAGITGGCTPVYSLFDNGVQVGSSNTSGVFNLPTTLTGPITVTVTSGCPTISGCPADCNNSQTITIDNACRQAPLCPTLVLGTSTTTSGPKCPGDIVSLCVNTTTSTNLPNGGTVEWYMGTTSGFDPYTSPSFDLVCSSNIVSTPFSCPRIAGVIVNACAGPRLRRAETNCLRLIQEASHNQLGIFLLPLPHLLLMLAHQVQTF